MLPASHPLTTKLSVMISAVRLLGHTWIDPFQKSEILLESSVSRQVMVNLLKRHLAETLGGETRFLGGVNKISHRIRWM